MVKGICTVIGALSFLVFGVWGLWLDCHVLYALGGAGLVLVGLLIPPVAGIFASLYAGIEFGDRLPLQLTAAGAILPLVFLAIVAKARENDPGRAGGDAR